MSGAAPLSRYKPQPADWGRLIPGDRPLQGKRKLPQSVKSSMFAAEKVVNISSEEPTPQTTLALLVPSPLQGRAAWRWLRSTATDFALVGLNWLLIATLRVPLKTLFPRLQWFRLAAGAPIQLMGIALLQGTLIALMGCIEGLYSGASDLRRQGEESG